MTDNTGSPEPAIRRVEIERVIARYPHLSEHELRHVLHFLRSEASSFDQAMMAANREIRPQYRQLCRDHYLDRLSPLETGFVILAGIAVFAVLVLAALFTDSGTGTP